MAGSKAATAVAKSAPRKKERKPVARPRTASDRQKRVAAILRRLDKDYPNVTCALQHRNAWELLVATILSAQCTDVRVNIVTPGLFKKYPTVADMAAAPQAELEQEIKTTGFFRNKSKSLIGAARKVLADFGGKVPDTMEEILSLPGVARKTANVVLGSWFGKATGVVVDTHVQRIARRLDLTKADDPKKIEQDLIKTLPQDRWVLFAHQIIHHGRKVCIARKPRCAECSLEDLCYAKDKML
jgi:endonuclease-3